MTTQRNLETFSMSKIQLSRGNSRVIHSRDCANHEKPTHEVYETKHAEPITKILGATVLVIVRPPVEPDLYDN